MDRLIVALRALGLAAGLLFPLRGSTVWLGDSTSDQADYAYAVAPTRYAAASGRKVLNRALDGRGFIWNGPEIQSQWHAPFGRRVLVSGGVNDLRHDVTGHALALVVQAFMEGLLAEGREVAFVNIGPWSTHFQSTPARQTQTTIYNAEMDAWLLFAPDCRTHGPPLSLGFDAWGVRALL